MPTWRHTVAWNIAIFVSRILNHRASSATSPSLSCNGTVWWLRAGCIVVKSGSLWTNKSGMCTTPWMHRTCWSVYTGFKYNCTELAKSAVRQLQSFTSVTDISILGKLNINSLSLKLILCNNFFTVTFSKPLRYSRLIHTRIHKSRIRILSRRPVICGLSLFIYVNFRAVLSNRPRPIFITSLLQYYYCPTFFYLINSIFTIYSR
jgi:hypothetical protein